VCVRVCVCGWEGGWESGCWVFGGFVDCGWVKWAHSYCRSSSGHTAIADPKVGTQLLQILSHGIIIIINFSCSCCADAEWRVRPSL
jgi:hypothetical protein